MPKITSVKPQKNNPKRFNVFVDGKFSFGADEDLVVEHRLIADKELTPEVIEKLLFEAGVGKLIERIYNLLSFRLRSEKEIRDYLKNLSFKKKVKDQEEISELAVDLLISKLKKKGLIDDEKFTLLWLESRRKSKFKSNTAIKSELMQKGIDKEIIEKIFSENEEPQETLAEFALDKKMRIWKNLERVEFKKKALEYLYRLGFDYDIAKHVIEKKVNLE